MADILTEEEQDREAHRSHILALAGFSFSGLLALVVLEAALLQGLHVAIYCLLLSFLFYMFALNLQGYKARRWQDQVATATMDVASLALILSVLSILHYQSFNRCFACVLSLSLSSYLAHCPIPTSSPTSSRLSRHTGAVDAVWGVWGVCDVVFRFGVVGG